ncbi:MAG TPA: DUF3048 domain-containing protein [Candidatus Limnocylindrales bacterium]
MPRLSRLAVLVLIVSGCSTAQVTPSPLTATPSQAAAPTTPALAEPPASPAASVVPSQAPSAFAPLDGMPADPLLGSRLPLAVMIDDNAVARPQSGFNAASIVYQAPADGGEDRYMLVFQEQDAADVGPVRSGRPYFVRWAAEYRAGFAHYGGDAKTLGQVIPSMSGTLIYNLDALFGSGSAFHRISSRKAPHNAYTSTAALRRVAAIRGAPAAMVPGLGLRLFKDDASEADRPAAFSITIPYGTGATGYAYDRATNAYLRSVAGRAQIDAGDGKRVTARNVVVLYMALSIDPQSEPGYRRPVLAQIGTGKAIVFRDGQAIPGTWTKTDAGALTRVYDESGKEIELVRGRIFVQVVPIGTRVTYRAG